MVLLCASTILFLRQQPPSNLPHRIVRGPEENPGGLATGGRDSMLDSTSNVFP
jgi:hypothetical protein